MKCVICGKESETSVCARCYMMRNKIVEVDRVEVETCPRCGFYRVGGRWRNVDIYSAVEAALEKALAVHTDFEVEEAELSIEGEKGFVRLKGSFRGEEVEQTHEFRINVKKTLCERCSREAGGYYESIVQLRAENRKLSEEEVNEASRIVSEVLEKEKENLKAFLTKVVERKEGIDYYIGGRDIGRKISRKIAGRFGGSIVESRKIAGRKDGRDLFRFTYSVRLPEYRKGDVVKSENGLVYVTNPRLGKGISLPDLSSANAEGRVFVRREEIEEGVVVNADRYAVEVLKSSGEVVLAEKAGNVKIGDSVYVFEYKGKHYVIPGEIHC